MLYRIFLLLVFCSAGCATGVEAQLSSRLELDAVRVAEKVVERLALEQGERVLLIGHPQFAQALVRPMRVAIARAGGIDLGYVEVIADPWPAGADGRSVRRSAAEARSIFREMFREVDAAVMLPGAATSHPSYQAMQDLLREGHGRTIHFHWAEMGSVVPVAGQPLPPAWVVDQTYQRALLETDYAGLAQAQTEFEQAMRAGGVRVTTPAGTDLEFRIGDRPVNRQDGDASAARMESAQILIDREIELPAGVVRVAPIEATVEGRMVFPVSQWDGRVVRNLTLHFEAGRVTEIEASEGRDAVLAEFESAGAASRRFREFALGLNPLLGVPERAPWIPYYGYGAGVVRLSLGDNSELGGEVEGGYVRWNFFEDASVRVGDHDWVKDGRLVRQKAVPRRF